MRVGLLLGVLWCAEALTLMLQLVQATDGDGKGEPGTYKAQKEAQRKREAGKESNIWHSLFIRSDTAVSALAEKFGMKEVGLALAVCVLST